MTHSSRNNPDRGVSFTSPKEFMGVPQLPASIPNLGDDRFTDATAESCSGYGALYQPALENSAGNPQEDNSNNS